MTWETKWREDMGEKGRGRHRREEGGEDIGEKGRDRHRRKREGET